MVCRLIAVELMRFLSSPMSFIITLYISQVPLDGALSSKPQQNHRPAAPVRIDQVAVRTPRGRGRWRHQGRQQGGGSEWRRCLAEGKP